MFSLFYRIGVWGVDVPLLIAGLRGGVEVYPLFKGSGQVKGELN